MCPSWPNSVRNLVLQFMLFMYFSMYMYVCSCLLHHFYTKKMCLFTTAGLHHGFTFVLYCSPFLFSLLHRWQFSVAWLHGRLGNCSDCRNVYHAILLLTTFCKILDNTETKHNHPFPFHLWLIHHRCMRCHQELEEILFVLFSVYNAE